MRMGSETEFGIFGGWLSHKARAIHKSLCDARPHLPSAQSGIHVENGGRFYVDQGRHNEYATPEVESPLDLVAYELAGRSMFAAAAAACGEVMLCSNLDYATGNTWGTHENYECSAPLPHDQQRRLAMHLATRIIYCGAGGLDPDCNGVMPVLSPRATRIRAELRVQGQLQKSLIFRKPDNYGSRHRLHVTAGESLLSHRAGYLKYATTALVIIALDSGPPCCWPQARSSSLHVLRRINRDLSFHCRIPLVDGRCLTAIEIQRTIFDAVAGQESSLPEWAPAALQEWAGALDLLASDTPSSNWPFDWSIWLNLVREFAVAQGIGMDAIRSTNARLRAADPPTPFTADLPPEAGLLRDTANELYIRLHTLAPDSLFDRVVLNRGIAQALPGLSPERIQAALTAPPPGRASLRAQFIRDRQAWPDACISWGYFLDPARRRLLLIPDRAEAEWETRWLPIEPRPDPQIDQLFRHGCYHDILARRPNGLLDWPQPISRYDLEMCLLCYFRVGHPFDLGPGLAALRQAGGTRFQEIALELFCRINEGLRPPVERLLPLIAEGLALPESSETITYQRLVFHQCRARCLSVLGRKAEALEILERLISEESDGIRPRMLARTRCLAAEVLRVQGAHAQALELARQAYTTHLAEQMWGDLADLSLPLLTRLDVDDTRAAKHLAEAERLACKTANELVLARILCLKARRLHDDSTRVSILTRFQDVSPLRTCPLAQRIQAEWTAWITTWTTDNPTDYWGLE